MFEFLLTLPIILVAFICGTFCWLCTSFGSAFVYLTKNLSNSKMAGMLAFAGGVMIASAIFSLLMPAITYCEDNKLYEFLFVVVGFLIGGFFILFSNKYLDKKLIKYSKQIVSSRKRNILLTSAITLHNIPEGMAIGVALGTFAISGDMYYFTPAVLLAIGIGIQNIPEGASVSIPLYRDNINIHKSFTIGVLSGIVEPIFAVIACIISFLIAPLLPFLLAFSAGAMMIVSISELIPESQIQNKYLSIVFTTLGFSVMALLDIILG